MEETQSHHPSRHQRHAERRVFHMLSGLGLVGLASGLFEQKREWIVFFATLTVGDFFLEVLRLKVKRLNLWIQENLSVLMRQGEENRLSGIFSYLLGCTLSVIIFPREIAVLSIVFLALGDPIAALVGVRWGRRRWPWFPDDLYKTVEGTLACFFVCLLATGFLSMIFTRFDHLSLSDRLLLSLWGGVAAALGELLPLRTDDNLSLPMISGATFWLGTTIWDLFPGLYLIE